MFVSSAEAFGAVAIKCASHPKEQTLLSKQIFHSIEILKLFTQIRWSRLRLLVALAVCSTRLRTLYSAASLTDVWTDVGQEIIDVLVATKKHEILILSRKVFTLSWLSLDSCN
jgi:hypothetical protein